MTRKKLAILAASTLALLWSYEIVTAVMNDSDIRMVMLLGLGCALALLVLELRAVGNDDNL